MQNRSISKMAVALLAVATLTVSAPRASGAQNAGAGGQSPAVARLEFVLGSAVPHRYDLVLGSHSVHTTPAALRDAQSHLATIRTRLVQEGRL